MSGSAGSPATISRRNKGEKVGGRREEGRRAMFRAIVLAALLAQQAAPSTPSGLDYEVFKRSVQPIFIAKRPGNARCVACHSGGNYAYLQKLPAGAATWDEEQTRKNFEAVRRYIVP